MALLKYALWCALALPLLAQNTGSLEGTVTNSITRAGIGDVKVTITQTTITGKTVYHTTTDASGTFRAEAVSPGDYLVSFEASEFMPPAPRQVRVTAEGRTERLDVALTAWAKISGRVVDGEGHPAVRVQVEMLRLHGGGGSVTGTDEQGKFLVRGAGPGTYVMLARPVLPGSVLAEGRPQSVSKLTPLPEEDRTVWAPTYFPDAVDYRQAQPIMVRGGAELSGYDIRLTAVPVHRLRGNVFDPDGRPAERVMVKLLATDLLNAPEAQVVSGHDGAFEFPAVRPGAWHLLAELQHDKTKWRSVGEVTVSRRDVDDVKVRLSAPFTMQGFVDREEPRDAKGERKLTAVYLVPVSGWPGTRVGAMHKQDGSVQFEDVLPGRYTVKPMGQHPGYYVDSIKLGEQEVLGREVELNAGSPPIRVIYKANAARVRGTVEKCGGASVVLIPQDEAFLDEQFIRRSPCDPAGKFEVGGLRPGDYYAFAFDRTDYWALLDPAFVRGFLARAEKVHLEPGETASIDLKVTPWPE